jgi:hypothetical protein
MTNPLSRRTFAQCLAAPLAQAAVKPLAEIEGALISVNGTAQRAKDGDQVKLDLPMKLAYAPVDPQHPRRVALVCGPVVLVRTQPGRLSAPAGDPGKWMAPRGEALTSRATRRNEDSFVPFCRLKFDESYEMYFDREA